VSPLGARLQALALGRHKRGVSRAHVGRSRARGGHLPAALGEHVAQQRAPRQRPDAVALPPQRGRRRGQRRAVLGAAQRRLRLVRLRARGALSAPDARRRPARGRPGRASTRAASSAASRVCSARARRSRCACRAAPPQASVRSRRARRGAGGSLRAGGTPAGCPATARRAAR